MSLWSRAKKLFAADEGRAGLLDRARRAAATGNLEEATACYLQAEQGDDAARMLELRAEQSGDPRRRLVLLKQAAQYAEGVSARRLEITRARMALDLVRSGRLELTLGELVQLGEELEALSEPVLAAEAYGLGSDVEAQARALVSAGAIERLEEVLGAEQQRHGIERKRASFYRALGDLDRSGQRRELIRQVEASTFRTDESFVTLVQQCTRRRVDVCALEVILRGERTRIVFGDNLVLGRSGASVELATPAVSRAHLSLRRNAAGEPEVVDLGSRNGTLLRGARLGAPLEIGAGLDLSLGGSVPLLLRPWDQGSGLPFGVRLSLPERDLLAPLGPLAIGEWKIEPGVDDWLELDPGSEECWLGGLRVDEAVQLCRGDRLRKSKSSEVLFEVPT